MMIEDVKKVNVPDVQGLHLSTDLILPRNAVTHVNGILAMRGSGKSYLASVLMEEMVLQGLFVGFIDPLGIAWGLRSSADGEQEGLPVLILGGRHGDVPLDPSAGTLVAQAVVEMRQPFILDLSLFDSDEEQQTFVAAFLLALKPYEQVLLHLIVDEADIFAPQMAQSKPAQRSLAAMNALARRYRVKGIGTTLITQRPAVLNKSVMQFDLLLALRMTLDHDITAVDAWVKTIATKEQRATFLATLPALATGTAWAWSPQWLAVFQQVHVRPRRTFDSSRTPDVDAVVRESQKLAEINLHALSTHMTALMAQAKATDPTFLQQRLQELQEELARVCATAPPGNVQATPNANHEAALATLRTEVEQTRQRLADKERETQELQQRLAHLTAVTVQLDGTAVPLSDLPAHLARLHSDQATITVGQIHDPSATTTARSQQRTEERVEASPVRSRMAWCAGEDKTFQRLLKRLEKLTGTEQALLLWLLRHEDTAKRPAELAEILLINERATHVDKIKGLLALPFVERTGKPLTLRTTFTRYAQHAFASSATTEKQREMLRYQVIEAIDQ
jgi:predicted metal-dependent enzyme (double-stranded beta helix superfamily)/DNA-binding CsgD family transcriptional regulator